MNTQTTTVTPLRWTKVTDYLHAEKPEWPKSRAPRWYMTADGEGGWSVTRQNVTDGEILVDLGTVKTLKAGREAVEAHRLAEREAAAAATAKREAEAEALYQQVAKVSGVKWLVQNTLDDLKRTADEYRRVADEARETAERIDAYLEAAAAADTELEATYNHLRTDGYLAKRAAEAEAKLAAHAAKLYAVRELVNPHAMRVFD